MASSVGGTSPRHRARKRLPKPDRRRARDELLAGCGPRRRRATPEAAMAAFAKSWRKE